MLQEAIAQQLIERYENIGGVWTILIGFFLFNAARSEAVYYGAERALSGLTVAGALTWRFTDSLGLEARVDTAKVDLEVTGGTVGVDLGNLLPGLPSIPISGDLEGQTEIGRLIPFSLNLQFQAGEKVRFVTRRVTDLLRGTSLSSLRCYDAWV